jgi:uncharacterized protein YfbU (UPF0304 family)
MLPSPINGASVGPENTVMQLSRTERLLLSNQYRILAKLYPDEAEHFAKAGAIVEDGYELEYYQLDQHISEKPLSEEQCREVYDILEMFWQIKHAYEGLADKTGIPEHMTEFFGFDGNYETRYLGYARFLFKDDRYPGLKKGDNYNSHAPLLPLMRKMVAEWKKSAVKHELTRDDLLRITSQKMDE